MSAAGHGHYAHYIEVAREDPCIALSCTVCRTVVLYKSQASAAKDIALHGIVCQNSDIRATKLLPALKVQGSQES